MQSPMLICAVLMSLFNLPVLGWFVNDQDSPSLKSGRSSNGASKDDTDSDESLLEVNLKNGKKKKRIMRSEKVAREMRERQAAQESVEMDPEGDVLEELDVKEKSASLAQMVKEAISLGIPNHQLEAELEKVSDGETGLARWIASEKEKVLLQARTRDTGSKECPDIGKALSDILDEVEADADLKKKIMASAQSSGLVPPPCVADDIPFVVQEFGKDNWDAGCTCGVKVEDQRRCEKAAVELGKRWVWPTGALKNGPWGFYTGRRRGLGDYTPAGCALWKQNDWTSYVVWNSADGTGSQANTDKGAHVCMNQNYAFQKTCEEYTCPSGTTNIVDAAGFWVNSGLGAATDAMYASVQANPYTMFLGLEQTENFCCGTSWQAHDPCPAGSGSNTGKVTKYMKPSASACPDTLAPFLSEWEGKQVTLCCKNAYGTAYGGGPVDDKRLSASQRVIRCKGGYGGGNYKRICNPNLDPCKPITKLDQPNFVGTSPGSNQGYLKCPRPGDDAWQTWQMTSAPR